MYLYGSLLVEGMYASGLVVYEHAISIIAAAVLLSSKLFFYFGVRIVGRSVNVSGLTNFSHLKYDEVDRVVILVLAVASICAGYGVAVDLIRVGALSGNFFGGGGLADVRADMWSDIYSEQVTASPLRSMMSVAAFCLAILLPFFVVKREALHVFISFFSCLVIVGESFTSAGRFSLALLVVCLVIASSLAFGKSRLREVVSLRVTVILGSLLFYSLIIFPVQRNPELPQAVSAYLSWLADAEIANWVMRVGEVPGFSWFTVLAYSSSYFSGALDKLSYFVTNTDAGEWYYLGLYNFPIVSQVGSALGISSYYWVEIRQLIASEMQYVGLAGNPWATGIRDFIIDFGLFFGTISAGLFGVALQVCYKTCMTNRRIYWKIMGVICVSAAFIMAFVSPFQIRLLSNSAIAVLLIIFFRWLIVSSSQGGNKQHGSGHSF